MLWLTTGSKAVGKTYPGGTVEVTEPNLQRVQGPSMAEHVLALMLALSRHLDYFMHEQAQGVWARGAPQEASDLEGKTVLVVGLGGIGTEVARRAHALGMRVTAIRASGREGPDYVSYVGLPDELLKLARDADFVVNCTPLTPQTTDIFNREFFAAMKPSAYFLSVGRGRSTVTADLIAALSSGKIAGAGLDTFAVEPLPADSPLLSLDNVVMTPHCASYADATARNLWRRVGEEAALALRGRMPNTPVNGQIRPNLTWLEA